MFARRRGASDVKGRRGAESTYLQQRIVAFLRLPPLQLLGASLDLVRITRSGGAEHVKEKALGERIRFSRKLESTLDFHGE